MSKEKQSVISKLWQELIDAQRAYERVKAKALAAEIDRVQREKREQAKKRDK